MEDFVNVSVRIRPTLNEEISSSSLQVIKKQPAILLLVDRHQTYHFDNIFTYDTSQEQIYTDTVKCLVHKVKAGYNCTVFAYGQTGTGKSYTIGTNPDIQDESQAGLISRTLEDFLNSTVEDCEVKISVSFIEIYNEKVFDLLELEKNKRPLSIKGFTVQGFTKMDVNNTTKALQLLRDGSRRRHIRGTKQNANSSRSHAIFSIYCSIHNGGTETIAKLNLVDLAGSESVRKTGNQGSSFYEGVNINKGLLSIGQVMTALSTNSNHIPYRQSVITTILQDSLNKKNYISLIACVSSNSEDLGETLQTLEFSNRVKKMRNKPEVNECIMQYKKENPALFAKVQTPLKRLNRPSYETPFKKPKITLSAIREPASETSSNFDISPLFSSSMTSAISDCPQNFSPVMRKYAAQTENSIMSKLEDLITNTIERSIQRRLPRDGKENENRVWGRRINKDATPDIDNDEDSMLIPSSDTSVTNDGHVITRDNLRILKVRRTNGPSHGNILLVDEDSPPKAENVTVFKIPEPITKRKAKNTSGRRRSVRLLTKKVSDSESESTNRRSAILHVTQNDGSGANRRRSVRLQLKATKSCAEIEQQSNISPTMPSPSHTCTCKKSYKSKTFLESPKDSPTTAREKEVLAILNTGTLRQIETLQTVGVKTAEKMLLFRQLKGKFKSLSALKEMPSWTQKKYEKFMVENFLRI